MKTLNRVGDSIVAEIETDNQTAELQYGSYRHLKIYLSDSKVTNNRSDKVTVTVDVVDGLEVYRGTDPADATVLDYDGGVRIAVGGQLTTKTLKNGSVSFDVTTEKQAGSTIEIVAYSLADHPAESDSATIEVVSP